MGRREYQSLLDEAMSASEDVWEVRDSEGRVARIERDPEVPGAKKVFVVDPAAPESPHARWRLPASARRPALYPDGIPFVPDIYCFIMEGGEHIIVTWRGDADPTPDANRLEAIRSSMPPGASELISAMRERVSEGKGARTEAATFLRQLRDNWSLEDMKEWIASVSNTTDLDERFERAHAHLIRESIASGWVEQTDRPSDETLPRPTVLRKNDRERRITLTGVYGVGVLILSEKPASPVEAA